MYQYADCLCDFDCRSITSKYSDVDQVRVFGHGTRSPRARSCLGPPGHGRISPLPRDAPLAALAVPQFRCPQKLSDWPQRCGLLPTRRCDKCDGAAGGNEVGMQNVENLNRKRQAASSTRQVKSIHTVDADTQAETIASQRGLRRCVNIVEISERRSISAGVSPEADQV